MFDKEIEYPLNIIVQLGEFPFSVNLEEVEQNFDEILTDYFNDEKCFLNEREKRIILYRYKEKRTLEDIAKDFNLTRERIRQIERKAITKIKYKKEMFYSDFDDYLLVKKNHDRKKEELIEKIVILDNLLFKASLLINDKQTTVGQIEEFMNLSEEARKNILAEFTDISDLDLSVRAYNCLRRARINTIGELAKKSVTDLMKVRNLGRKCLKEIIETLRDLGIELRDE